MIFRKVFRGAVPCFFRDGFRTDFRKASMWVIAWFGMLLVCFVTLISVTGTLLLLHRSEPTDVLEHLAWHCFGRYPARHSFDNVLARFLGKQIANETILYCIPAWELASMRA